MSITAMKQALEAMNAMLTHMGMDEDEWNKVTFNQMREAIKALEEALAKQEQGEPVTHWSDCAMHSEPAYPAGECDCGGFNPVAWLVENDDGPRLYWTYKEPIGNEKWTPLFSIPQQRDSSATHHTWVGLTHVERLGIRSRVQEYTRIDSVKYGEAIQLATEAAIKEKNA